MTVQNLGTVINTHLRTMNFKKYVLAGLLLFSFACFNFSCERNTLLYSESGLKKKLNGTWDLVLINPDWDDETWKFDNGEFTLTVYNGARANGVRFVKKGRAQGLTTLATPYIFITDINTHYSNGKWEIYRFTKSQLSIARLDDFSNGLLLREFTKR